MITEPARYYDLISSDELEVSNARIVNDNMVEVQYKSAKEFGEPNNRTNVVIAAFTTAYARLKLYDLLDLLQERALYYDTDSVIYVSEPGKPDPPLGNYLGDLTDEFEQRPHYDVLCLVVLKTTRTVRLEGSSIRR